MEEFIDSFFKIYLEIYIYDSKIKIIYIFREIYYLFFSQYLFLKKSNIV